MCMLTGAYRVPAYRALAHVRLTNKTPAATYRAPGRFESTFVRSRLMDAVADQLGLDRIEVRRRNLIAASQMPYTIAFDEPGVEELELDSGDYAALLDKALAAFGWQELQQELARRRAAGEAVGAGVAIFLEESGRGPTDNAKISVDGTGAVELITGGASLGQGFETAMAQICAEALGVDYRSVRVIHGQTDLHRSRHRGACGARHRAHRRRRACHRRPWCARRRWSSRPSCCRRRRRARHRGRHRACGATARAVPRSRSPRSRRRIAPGSKLLRGRPPQLAAHGWYNTDHTVFPYGVHLAAVRVDRDTGAVAVERFMVAYDVGRAVNPLLIEGQLVGGCVQGLGGALARSSAMTAAASRSR